MIQEVSYFFAEFVAKHKLLRGKLWIGRAHDAIANPKIDCYCLATSKEEAEKWAEKKAWQMYDSRERIMR